MKYSALFSLVLVAACNSVTVVPINDEEDAGRDAATSRDAAASDAGTDAADDSDASDAAAD